MRNNSIFPRDINLKNCSLTGIAGGIIQGEVLRILIEDQDTSEWSRIDLRKFKKIMINEEMGVPIDDHFIRECLSCLEKRKLAHFNEEEAWLTDSGIKEVYNICI